MSDEHPSDADIDGWLHTLGITSLCQWDVLLFLYRHQTSLVGADSIARFLGYAKARSSPPWTCWRAWGLWYDLECL